MKSDVIHTANLTQSATTAIYDWSGLLVAFYRDIAHIFVTHLEYNMPYVMTVKPD